MRFEIDINFEYLAIKFPNLTIKQAQALLLDLEDNDLEWEGNINHQVNILIDEYIIKAQKRESEPLF